jgi:gas vesicle protein
MKFNIARLIAASYRQLTKVTIGVSLLALVWQSAFFGVDLANASPLFATSMDSMSKQVSGKAEEMTGSAKQSMGEVQSAIEDKSASAKMKVKDGLTETKTAVDASNNRVENAAEKVTDSIKNFFGK